MKNAILLIKPFGFKPAEIPKGKGGQNLGEYLRKKSIKNVWKSLCEEAKAEGLECTPHSFAIDVRTLLISNQNQMEL